MSVTTKVELKYSLYMVTSFSTCTGSKEAMSANSLVRDASGNLYLPGSTIKGKVRDNCSRLVRTLGGSVCGAPVPGKMCFGEIMCPVCSLFGSPYNPSPLYFSDARLDKEHLKVRDSIMGALTEEEGARLARRYDVRHHTRTRVSRARGVAKEGSLFTLQSVEGGQVFKGTVYGRVKLNETDDPGCFYELIMLLAAVKMTDFIGSGNSIGLGKCLMNVDTLLIGDVIQPGSMTDKMFDYLEDLTLWLDDEGGAVI